MRLLKVLLILLAFGLLAACSPSVDNEDGIETPLPDDGTPSSPEILETATSLPASTPTLKVVPTLTKQKSPIPKETSTRTTQNSSGEQDQEAVVIFHQEGGFAGVDISWIIFTDGRIEQDDEPIGELDSSQMELLLDDIDRSGVLELDMAEPGNFCCDFFTYTITAVIGDKTNTVSVSEADPELPSGLVELIKQLHQITSQTP